MPPSFSNQNSWRWVDVSLSFDSYEFTLLFKNILHLFGQETAEEGKDEHSSLNQILRIKAVHLSLFMSVWRWPLVVWSFTVPNLGGCFVGLRLDCHICAQCTWRGSFCRLYLVRFSWGVCLIHWAANSTHTWTCAGLMVGRIDRKVSCCS